MSNHKYAFGWSGHILARKSEQDEEDRKGKMKRTNCIAIPDEIFDRIATDMDNCELPVGIEVHQLGWLAIETVHFLAAGAGFTESFEYYGAPFEEAELRLEKEPLARDVDADYLAAMKQHYGLELPPCRLMVGCASEH